MARVFSVYAAVDELPYIFTVRFGHPPFIALGQGRIDNELLSRIAEYTEGLGFSPATNAVQSSCLFSLAGGE